MPGHDRMTKEKCEKKGEKAGLPRMPGLSSNTVLVIILDDWVINRTYIQSQEENRMENGEKLAFQECPA